MRIKCFISVLEDYSECVVVSSFPFSFIKKIKKTSFPKGAQHGGAISAPFNIKHIRQIYRFKTYLLNVYDLIIKKKEQILYVSSKRSYNISLL